MFAFHWMKCIIISVTLRVGSAAFVPFAPTTLSSKIHVTHFTCPKPQSSSSLVVVTQQISPATSSTALNVETNNFDLVSAGFAVGLASLIVAIVTWVGSSLEKRLDGISTQMVTNKADLEKQIVTIKADLEKRFDKMDKRFDKMDKRMDGIDAELKGLNTSFITYLGTKKK